MSLSINKLDGLLASRGLVPKKYFSIKRSCVYIEVLSLATADRFMLYIPSKYDITLNGGNDVYNLEYMEVTEDGNIPSDYAGEPDNFDLEKQYDGIDLSIDPTDQTKDISASLEESYNHPVSLKDVSHTEKQRIREVFRQLRRLKFCVQSISYKLCIFYKCFLCCIRRDDTFEGFVAARYPGTPTMSLMVTLDLEALYGKLDSVSVDIATVREGVCRVLDRNYHRHTVNLGKMLSHKDTLTSSGDSVARKKAKYVSYLSRLSAMLATTNLAEEKQLEKLARIEEQYTAEASVKGLHSDIERSHQVAKCDGEIGKIGAVKEEIVRNIIGVRRKIEDLSLRADRICFDNSVMIDAIVKNFIQLSEL
jgi:hypothetical protein